MYRCTRSGLLFTHSLLAMMTAIVIVIIINALAWGIRRTGERYAG